MKECGHYFCRGCIIRAYENKKECPIDRYFLASVLTYLQRKPLRGKVDNNLLPNFLAREQIESLLIYCPYGLRRSNLSGEWIVVRFLHVSNFRKDENADGCREKIPFGKKSLHEKECPYSIVQCRVIDDETVSFTCHIIFTASGRLLQTHVL